MIHSSIMGGDFFRRRLRSAAAPVIGACLAAYFAYHAVQGDRGLIALAHLETQIEEAQARLDELVAIREREEVRVNGLSPRGVDPDLLDERLRAMLNLTHPDELVLPLPR